MLEFVFVQVEIDAISGTQATSSENVPDHEVISSNSLIIHNSRRGRGQLDELCSLNFKNVMLYLIFIPQYKIGLRIFMNHLP